MKEARLHRQIGSGGAFLLAFNGVVGGAIFALPAVLARDFGAFSPWLFPIVGTALLLIAIPFARSAARFPHNGGPALYGAAFGRFAGFELGWLYYLARMVSFAANANVLAAYLARWWAPADDGAVRVALILFVCVMLVIVNISGTKRAIRLLGGLTLVKGLPLLGIAVAAILLSIPLPSPGPPPAFTAFEAGVLLAFYAFMGFESVVVPAGETKRPERALPLAIFATLASTTLLYFLVQLAYVAALPGGSADESAPLIDLGRAVAGPAGAAVLTLAAIASLGANLHGAMTSSARVTSGMAEIGDLPRWFGKVHSRFLTPHNSIAFFGAGAAALAIVGTYFWLIVISALARLFVYAVTIAALPRAPGVGRVPVWLYLVGAGGIAFCVLVAAQATAEAWRTLGLLAFAGAVLYAIASRSGASSRDAATVSAIQPPPSSRDP